MRDISKPEQKGVAGFNREGARRKTKVKLKRDRKPPQILPCIF